MSPAPYMLARDRLGAREKRWGVVLADPEWAAVVARTEGDWQLVEDILKESFLTSLAGRSGTAAKLPRDQGAQG
jgi:hypothetical protein